MIRKLNKTVAGIFTCMMSISLWIGSSFPCILFFGEYEYPRKEDYED